MPKRPNGIDVIRAMIISAIFAGIVGGSFETAVTLLIAR